MASVNKSGVYANEHGEPPGKGNEGEMPNLEIIKVDHQSVLLSWKEISNQKRKSLRFTLQQCLPLTNTVVVPLKGSCES